MMSRYLGPMKWLGGAALIAILIGLILPSILNTLLSEEVRASVLANALPFFAIFIGILLLFILLIVLVALRYNGKVPTRTYRGIELTIVVGILFGVICLFQSFSFVPYRYGFLLLLVATLGFILWSHVVPGSRRLESTLKPVSGTANVLGLVAALIIIVLVVVGGANANAPREPYGERQRVWNSFSDERKAEIAAAATSAFNTIELPFLVILGLFPGLIVFFVVREIVTDHQPVEAAAPIAAPLHSR
jgi:hypothetical protein